MPQDPAAADGPEMLAGKGVRRPRPGTVGRQWMIGNSDYVRAQRGTI